MAKADGAQIDRLAALARDGDRRAFSQIVRMMMNNITALTYRMTGDREAAKDLTQETFVSAWENLGNFRGEAAFSSWLFRIASNKTLNYLKSADRKNKSLDAEQNEPMAIIETDGNPERDISNRQLREQLQEFLTELPQAQRQVFELRFYQQLRFSEIATVIGKAEGTAKTHYRLAVAKLREWAKDKGWHQ
ncbi:MAG TPA: RNA polymerase sigma factor [candidate division Zixibacteria bacterium]|nr:RNA polymerase sigma factor [candidate division Zixibacteria bacterium]